ncbi:MAG: hypothetical protein AB7O67_22850 [Vicinamibacterales bacterium]
MPSRPGPRHAYRISGLTISSDLPLSPLPAASGRRADWHLALAAWTPAPETAAWFRRWYDPDRRLWLRFGRLADGYRLRFAHSASFDVHPGRRLVICRREPGTPRRTVRHLFLNQVLPLVAATPERLVLHASAVSGSGGVVAFVGAGGRGKSTLAAALVARGHDLFCDDALMLEMRRGRFAARPAFPELRLWPDAARALQRGNAAGRRAAHYTTKRRVTGLMHSSPGRARVLGRIYLLDRSRRARRDISFARLRPRDAALQLVRSAFVLDTTDRHLMRGTFEQIAALVTSVPVFRLQYPDALDRLAEVAAAVVAHRPGRDG